MVCGKCGKKLPSDSFFCRFCGAKVDVSEQEKWDDASVDIRPRSDNGTAGKEDIMRRIIGKNADYYLTQFGRLQEREKNKINWASFFLSIYHASYRGVWKEWLNEMKLPLIASLLGSVVMFVSGVFASLEAMMAVSSLVFIIEIWLIAKNILTAKRFNRIYMAHIENKISCNDQTPDPSGKRALFAILAAAAISLCTTISTEISTAIYSDLDEASGFVEENDAVSNYGQETPPDDSEQIVDTEQLTAWLLGKIAETSPSISEKERSELDGIAESDFASAWKSALASALDDCCQFEISLDGADNILSKAIALYKDMYGQDNQISDIRKLADGISICLQSNKDLKANYSFDLETIAYSQSGFYITQRLGSSYLDNFLGELQEKLDSTDLKAHSDWAAYNVEYAFGTAMPGSICSVIRSDNMNPFPESGVYNIAYIDTGTTMDVTSTEGFTQTVPVYQMIDDLAAFNADRTAYQENYNNALIYYENIIQFLS